MDVQNNFTLQQITLALSCCNMIIIVLKSEANSNIKYSVIVFLSENIEYCAEYPTIVLLSFCNAEYSTKAE